ncbi:hypothetical protein [Streptomyces caeruleatus]|uniref:Extensin n=1 Tax=Streptomyces caeruleatus TaxID=661399 RepID=A0A101TTY4_9ACTN|nr:hypothetical protein [Streptomyces caeruleatus]KUN98425.1 hypothetical protein AQJ67_27145 [Streptomyces caeruleatus]
MADERCDFPGADPRTPGQWLDRETAERLLRGESLEAVDAADRDEAERLAKTLEALTVEPPLSSAELPGETAALAAFRAARADRDDCDDIIVSDGPGAGAHPEHPADVGLVRIGGPARATRRPRWARPVRLGLAAALAVGMVGGVAVAAGTGLLPTPFGGDEGGRPAASVSAPVPSDRPFVSPSPESRVQGDPTPDDDATASADPGSTHDTAPGGPATDRESAGDDRVQPSAGWWKAVTSYCRDLREGKQLSKDHRRTLEGAAGGSERVRKYCKNVLKATGDGTWSKPGNGKDKDKDRTRDKAKGREKDDDEGDRADRHPDGRGGRYGGDHGDRHGNGSRDGHGNDHRVDGAAVAPSAVADLLTNRILPRLTPLTRR